MRAGVVGAGIMGRLLALRLQNEGWHVTLFDQNLTTTPHYNCSYAAAGLLAPISELEKADHIIYQLGIESINKHWPAILEQLPNTIYFQRNGCLIVHHPKDQSEWQQFQARITKKLEGEYYQSLSHNELLHLEPELAKIKTAYFLPEEAHIDNQAVLAALDVYLPLQGVKWLPNTTVTSVRPGELTTAMGTERFDMVFDCRGLGAKSTFPDLRGLRGELIWLYAPDVRLQRPVRFLHPRYNIYIAPRPGHHYIIGASELESDDHSEISVRSTLELLTAAYYVHAGFAEARVVKTVTQCRPTLPNHLPRIKFSDKLIAVNGLYRHGYLIAPTLAEEIIRGLNTSAKGIFYPEIWETWHDNHLH